MYLYNGNIVSGLSVETSNRAFKYGDAFFETMLYHNGRIPLLQLHLERAKKTLGLLKMESPEAFSNDGFEQLLLGFLQKENYPTAKVRISFWRNGGGTYLPTENSVSYIVEALPITTQPFALNEKGLLLDIYRDTYKNTDFLANLKTVGCITYTLASMWVKEQDVDDAILLNNYGRIAECTSSNIFLVKGEEIITPPLNEGCLDGVMRRHLLNTLPQKGYKVTERSIEIEELNTVNEIFTTNALGIKWVSEIRGKYYTNDVVSEIVRVCNENLK